MNASGTKNQAGAIHDINVMARYIIYLRQASRNACNCNRNHVNVNHHVAMYVCTHLHTDSHTSLCSR